MKRMNLDGALHFGPSLPSRCSTRVAKSTCSQSSINSHKWDSPGRGGGKRDNVQMSKSTELALCIINTKFAAFF